MRRHRFPFLLPLGAVRSGKAVCVRGLVRHCLQHLVPQGKPSVSGAAPGSKADRACTPAAIYRGRNTGSSHRVPLWLYIEGKYPVTCLRSFTAENHQDICMCTAPAIYRGRNTGSSPRVLLRLYIEGDVRGRFDVYFPGYI